MISHDLAIQLASDSVQVSVCLSIVMLSMLVDTAQASSQRIIDRQHL